VACVQLLLHPLLELIRLGPGPAFQQICKQDKPVIMCQIGGRSPQFDPYILSRVHLLKVPKGWTLLVPTEQLPIRDLRSQRGGPSLVSLPNFTSPSARVLEYSALIGPARSRCQTGTGVHK
jgi:hypothetical protein